MVESIASGRLKKVVVRSAKVKLVSGPIRFQAIEPREWTKRRET